MPCKYNLRYSGRYFNTDCQFEMFKRVKDNGYNKLFKKTLVCWYTLELPQIVNSNVYTEGRRQSKTLSTIDERGSKIDRNSIFDFRKLNSVSNEF